MAKSGGFFFASCARAGSVVRNAISDLAQRPPESIPGLDALRSLAIILVFSDHYSFNFERDTGRALAIGKFPLFYFGWSGVDLFFVLSGYLIGRALWKELDRTGTLNVPRFLLRRGMRIWPYYFGFIAFSMIATCCDGAREYLPDLFFYSNYREGRIAGGWSLSTEEQFYVAVPLTLILVRRWLPLSKQWILPTVALVALPIARALAVARLGPHAHEGMDRFIIYTPFHTHADGLVVGLLLAWVSVARPAVMAGRGFLSNAWLPLVLMVGGFSIREAGRDLFSFTSLALLFGGCVLFFIRDRSVITRITTSRIFYVISKLSYAMYLNHFIVLYRGLPYVLDWLGGETLGYGGFVVGYAVTFLLSLGIASVTFALVESPFLQLRDWLLDKKHAPPVLAPAAEVSD